MWFRDSHSRIDVYNTDTMTEVGVIDNGAPFGWIDNAPFSDGRLRISKEGSLLFATVPGGVNVYVVPEPSAICLLAAGAVAVSGWACRRRMNRPSRCRQGNRMCWLRGYPRLNGATGFLIGS